MVNPLHKPVYVAGVAESPLGNVVDQSELSMVALAANEALAEAGMSFRDVDGVFSTYMGEYSSVHVAEYLGISPRYADSTNIGGASFEAFLHHSMLAVAGGRCEVALVAYASRQRSRRSRKGALSIDASLAGQFEAPHGLQRPIGYYALSAARHMHQYGITLEHLSEVAVAARRWAQLNEKAWRREPLSIEDVMASPMISDPLRKADCCLVTDGGGALVVTTAERARDAAKKPIRILGAGEAHVQWHVSQSPDLTVTPAAISGREAFAMAGVVPDDIDVFEPYDNFTHSVILQLEDLGFCGKGEGGAFVEGGALAPGGRLPSMTSGGGLSYCHPGALGLLLIVEAVRQLRGECGLRQVPDARLALAHGVGGAAYSTGATVIMARD